MGLILYIMCKWIFYNYINFLYVWFLRWNVDVCRLIVYILGMGIKFRFGFLIVYEKKLLL